MWEAKQIDDTLCDSILDTYRDNPLLKAVKPDDAQQLLMSSVYAAAPEGDAPAVFEDGLPGFFTFMEDYFKATKPEDIVLPVLLLKGAPRYAFGQPMAPPPAAGIRSFLRLLFGYGAWSFNRFSQRCSYSAFMWCHLPSPHIPTNRTS
jgi:hypothetical protein